jgi:Putative restriction endonuclease
MSAKVEATIEDLYRVPENGKAEIVNGEIVLMPPNGNMPARAGFRIATSLAQMEGKIPGRAYPDNAGFLVHLPNRRSFSPDAAWYVGPSSGMKFLEGAPIFVVEVRSGRLWPTRRTCNGQEAGRLFRGGHCRSVGCRPARPRCHQILHRERSGHPKTFSSWRHRSC